jgi:16S rRNA (guanine527-N7)-methyltransferase
VKPSAATARVQQAARAFGIQLSGEQVAQLLSFEALLRERGIPMGLVAPGDEAKLVDRHLIDSLRGAAVVGQADRRALDLGSGAGLPGLVVAAARPWLDVALIEPRRRRVAFLELAVERLGLSNARILATRAEDVADRADLCFARALSPLARSWELARPLLRPGGRLVYFSGPLEDPPPVPARAASVEVGATRWVDSPGPLVMITRP